MPKNPGHQPERFHQYIELQDKSGFTLDGNPHVFKYEEDGGWYDEYGNYYNADGQPQIEDSGSSQGSWSEYSQYQQDEYEKQFGPSWEVQDYFEEQSHQSQKIIEKIAANNILLEQHDKNSPLRIDFQILDIKQDEEPPTISQIIKALRKKKVDIINAFYNKDLKEYVGGYLVVRDLKAGTRLIHLEGENICEFDFTFDVQKFKQLQIQPLDQVQLEEFEGQQKFISLKEGQIVKCFNIEGGLTCDKKQFMKWYKQQGIDKKGLQIVKIKKQGKNKYPIIKLKQQDAKKIEGKQFLGKKVSLDPYKQKTIKQQDQQQQTEKKQEKKEEEVEKKEEQTK